VHRVRDRRHQSIGFLLYCAFRRSGGQGARDCSDHDAIETVFDFPWPIPKYQERLLLKNAPWNEINTVSMASWSEPWSVPSIAHLIMESVKFSEAKTR
jgi:hypothetical protein